MTQLPNFPDVPAWMKVEDQGRTVTDGCGDHWGSVSRLSAGENQVVSYDHMEDPHKRAILDYAKDHGVFPMSTEQEAALVPRWVDRESSSSLEWWHRNVDLPVVKVDPKGGASLYGVDTRHHWTKEMLQGLIPALDFVTIYGRLPLWEAR